MGYWIDCFWENIFGKVFLIVLVIYDPQMRPDDPEQSFDQNIGRRKWMVQEKARLAIQSTGKVLTVGDFNHRELEWFNCIFYMVADIARANMP